MVSHMATSVSWWHSWQGRGTSPWAPSWLQSSIYRFLDIWAQRGEQEVCLNPPVLPALRSWSLALPANCSLRLWILLLMPHTPPPVFPQLASAFHVLDAASLFREFSQTSHAEAASSSPALIIVHLHLQYFCRVCPAEITQRESGMVIKWLSL